MSHTTTQNEEILFQEYKQACSNAGRSHHNGSSSTEIFILESKASKLADRLEIGEQAHYDMMKHAERDVISSLPSPEPWTCVPEPEEVEPDPRSGVEDRDNDPSYSTGTWSIDWSKGEMVRVTHENVTAVVSPMAKVVEQFAGGWTLNDMFDTPAPKRHPYVINGLVREGETGQINAPSKAGKSWLVLNIAIDSVCGNPSLGAKEQEPVDVILFDSELHESELKYRVSEVVKAKGLTSAPMGKFTAHNLRGNLGKAFSEIRRVLSATVINRPTVCILDALYRFIPDNASENSNSDITKLFNELDSIAAEYGVAFLNIHHSSKGDQSQKNSLDVGAGAGAFARAPDTIISMREHAEDGLYVFDVTRRSDVSPPRSVYRRDGVLWIECPDKDPELKRSEYTATKRKAESAALRNEKAADKRRQDAGQVVSDLREAVILSQSQLVGQRRGKSRDVFKALLLDMETSGVIHRVKYTQGRRGVKTPVSTLDPMTQKAVEAGDYEKRVYEGYTLTSDRAGCLNEFLVGRPDDTTGDNK